MKIRNHVVWRNDWTFSIISVDPDRLIVSFTERLCLMVINLPYAMTEAAKGQPAFRKR